MTKQFKFGDRVKYGATDFLFIHDKGDGRAHVVSETGVSGVALISDLTLIPHPDTARLDWLIKRNFDFQKCYDMGGRWWYEDSSFDEIEAIDKVMEKETQNESLT